MTICGWRYLGKDVQIFEPVIVLKPEVISIGDHSRIDGFVKIEGGLGIEIGDYCHIASFSHINGGGGRVIMGNHSGIASGVKISGGVTDISYLHVTPVEDPKLINTIRKVTIIGEYVVIFSNAVILPGVLVGFGAIVAAGAVVTKNIPDFEIWAGNPAKRIGVRTASERGLDESEHQL